MRILALSVFFLMTACVTEPVSERKFDVKVTKSGGEAKIWVFKPDGSRQCGEAKASLSVSDATQELKDLGIMVFQAQNGTDGMMHSTVCGGPTGRVIQAQIARADLAKAQGKGYRPLPGAPAEN